MQRGKRGTQAISRRGLLKGAAATGAVLSSGGLSTVARAASTTRTASSAGGGQLIYTIARSILVGGLDATQTVETEGLQVSQHISEPLIGFDARTNKPVPRLAESWSLSKDGLSLTLNLRSGVTFHDGTPLDADAVVWSLQRVFYPNGPMHDTGKYPYVTWLSSLDKIEKVDAGTVVLRLKKVDPIIVWRLSLPPTYIQSPTAVKKWGAQYTNHPVGTGPYRFVALQQGVQAVIERNEQYWGTKPNIARIVFKLNGDQHSRTNDILAGATDLVEWPLPDELPTLRKTAGLRVQIFPSLVLGYYYMNKQKPVLNDPRVRQALAMLYDRQTASHVLDADSTVPMSTFWFPGAYGYAPNLPVNLAYNPKKAAALLAAAGRRRGSDGILAKGYMKFATVLNTSGTTVSPDLLMYQAALKTAGISASISLIDPAVQFDPKIGFFNPAVANIVTFGVAAALPDPSFVFDRWLSSERAPKGFNISQYSNPQMDRLWALSETELDLQKRAGYFRQMQQLADMDPPWIPISNAPMVVATKHKVQNIYYSPLLWFPYLTEWTVTS
jgi:peptide/nickel transport system substrate-binding protein